MLNDCLMYASSSPCLLRAKEVSQGKVILSRGPAASCCCESAALSLATHNSFSGMSLRFVDLGSVCAAPNCGHVDFLPMRCERCRSMFCSAHIGPERHRCQGQDDDHKPHRQGSGPRSASRRNWTQCAACGKAIPLELGVSCDHCVHDAMFCVAHRHHDSSSHPHSAVARTKGAAAPAQLDGRWRKWATWLVVPIQVQCNRMAVLWRPSLQALLIVLAWMLVLWACARQK